MHVIFDFKYLKSLRKSLYWYCRFLPLTPWKEAMVLQLFGLESIDFFKKICKLMIYNSFIWKQIQISKCYFSSIFIKPSSVSNVEINLMYTNRKILYCYLIKGSFWTWSKISVFFWNSIDFFQIQMKNLFFFYKK